MEKKEKEEKKKKPAATITLIDLKRAGTFMGAHNAFPQCHGSSMGAQSTVLRPDDLTQLEGAVFDSTMFEKGPMSPLPPTPVRLVSMPVQQQQQQQQQQQSSSSSSSSSSRVNCIRSSGSPCRHPLLLLLRTGETR